MGVPRVQMTLTIPPEWQALVTSIDVHATLREDAKTQALPEDVRTRMREQLPKEVQVGMLCQGLPRSAGAPAWMPPTNVRLPLSSPWVCVARCSEVPMHPRNADGQQSPTTVLVTKAACIPTLPSMATARGGRSTAPRVLQVRLGVLRNHHGGSTTHLRAVRVLAVVPPPRLESLPMPLALRTASVAASRLGLGSHAAAALAALGQHLLQLMHVNRSGGAAGGRRVTLGTVSTGAGAGAGALIPAEPHRARDGRANAIVEAAKAGQRAAQSCVELIGATWVPSHRTRSHVTAI